MRLPYLDASGAASRGRSGGSNDIRESYSLGFDAGWEIDVFGGVRRSVAAADADLDAMEANFGDVQVSLAAYEQTVLNALEEMKNAMTVYAEDQETETSLRQAADAARRAEELAREYYLSGMADSADVLEAQRAVLSFEDQLAESKGTVAAELIRLYKALGGGWGGKAERLSAAGQGRTFKRVRIPSRKVGRPPGSESLDRRG